MGRRSLARGGRRDRLGGVRRRLRPLGRPQRGSGARPCRHVAYLSLDTELESAKWQALAALVDRFPSGAEVLDRLADLGPALGPEVGLALLGPAGGAHRQPSS